MIKIQDTVDFFEFFLVKMFIFSHFVKKRHDLFFFSPGLDFVLTATDFY